MAFNEKIMEKLKEESSGTPDIQAFVSKLFMIESGEPVAYQKEYEKALKVVLGEKKEGSK